MPLAPANFSPYRLAPPPPPRRDRATPGARGPETLSDPPVSREINAALLCFAVDQRNARAMSAAGDPMPPEVRAGWASLLASVDRFLAWPPPRTAPLDVVRARVALDAELDMDRTFYAGLPHGLVASVHARVLSLDARLSAVRGLLHAVRPAEAQFAWPIEPVIVTSLFGDRADPFSGEGQTHLGVDLKAEKGQLVGAAAEGVVLRSGRIGGHGLHVELRHPSGALTRYSHLSLVLVQVGMHVPARGPLGLAGNTGRSTGPHLHFELWKAGEPVDPLSELPDPVERELGVQNVGSGE
jgi:hypothetical protein